MEDVEQLNNTIIIIDWGFTRLKLWSINHENNILDAASYYTSNLVDNPKFYDHKDIVKISNIVKTFIGKHSTNSNIEVHSCSQMHGLVGKFEDGEFFFSTWNDVISTDKDSNYVAIIDGVPNLHSMPNNKLVKQDKGYYIRSEFCKRSANKIQKLYSPVSLLLSIIYNKDLVCDLGWWQSTCIDERRGIELDVNVSDQPILIEVSPNQEIKGGTVKEIKILPETGDLQASTSKALDIYDVLVNIGTGSQIIINDDFCSNKHYFRYWNSKLSTRCVISHIPCGRLLSDFCNVNKLDMHKLREIFTNRISDLVNIVPIIGDNSILYFPGYCSRSEQYINVPSLRLDGLRLISANELLDYWIMQYVNIIQRNLIDSPRIVNVGISGDLGGFAHILCKGLTHYLGERFNIELININLPESLIQYNQKGASENR